MVARRFGVATIQFMEFIKKEALKLRSLTEKGLVFCGKSKIIMKAKFRKDGGSSLSFFVVIFGGQTNRPNY